MPLSEIRTYLIELTRCRYKGLYEELEIRCVVIISVLSFTSYKTIYEVFVVSFGFYVNIVLLVTSIWLLSILLGISFFEKKKKKYIIESDGFKWRVTRYINNSLSVDETPLCGKDEVPLVHDGQVLYCPKCNEVKMKSGDLLNFLHRVNSKAEADRDSSIKVPKRYIPA